MFTGLKVKQYSEQELEAFKGPFLKGWRREVVLRGTVTNSGKKIGDVYYYSPDKKTKLRSYVEMGLFLRKNSACGLEPENFTFARQPVYKPPEEIVRHAMTRGSNQPVEHFATSPPAAAPINSAVAATSPALPPPAAVTSAPPSKPQVVTRRSQSNSSSVDPVTPDTPDTPSLLQQEGRAKRKRVAPTRFEDEEYLDNSPFKKKSSTDKQPAVKAEKLISPLAAATSSASGSKTIETKVNAQGRTSIIIRTPIRKAATTGSLPPVASVPDPKPQIQVQNPISETGKPADVKAEDEVNNQVPAAAPGASSADSSDSESTAAAPVKRIAERLVVSKSESGTPVTANGSLSQALNSGPPPLQPIRVAPAATSVAVVSAATAVTRKESRPATAPQAQQATPQPQQAQQSMRKASIVSKNGLSILTSNATPLRSGNEQNSSFKPIRPKPVPRSSIMAPDVTMDGSVDDTGMVPPCSIMCGGGQCPGLLCSRCLCLFHPQCVQRGIHLIPGNQFVCPNCIQPTDQGRPIGVVNGNSGHDDSGIRSSSKKQPSSRNSSRAGSPMNHSLIRNQLLKSSLSSGAKSHPNQPKGPISTMMDKRQQSQLQLLQKFQEIAGIRPKNSASSRPLISRPVPVKKQQIVQNRGHLRLSAAAVGRESRPLFPQNQNRMLKMKERPAPPLAAHQQQANPAPASTGHHQHLSELISHHLDSVSRLLQEITMLKYSNCKKVSWDFLLFETTTNNSFLNRLLLVLRIVERGLTLFEDIEHLLARSLFVAFAHLSSYDWTYLM